MGTFHFIHNLRQLISFKNSFAGLCPAVSSLVQAKRFRGKINLRKPRTPHFEKQLFTEFTRPKFVKKYQDTNIIEVCSFLEPPRHEVPENPYQKILAKELRERFENTRLIVFYHINPVSGEDKLRTEINFKKENMLLMVHARSTLKMALEGTPYEAVLPFYISHNAILFCPEPDIKKLLKMSKRIPHLILLGNNQLFCH